MMRFFKAYVVVLIAIAVVEGQNDVGAEFPSVPPVPTIPPDLIVIGDGEPTSSTAAPAMNPLSLFPLPNGPFYGFPFDTRQTVNRYLPLTVSGTCEARSIYNITHVKDLLSYRTELECIFNQGQAPNKVPTGSYYANVLTAFNTQLFNLVASNFWSGVYVNTTECNGVNKFIGWNNLFGRPLFPFEARIEPLHLNIAPGEYNDGRSSLILDHTTNLARSCPDYRSNVQRSYQDSIVRRRVLNSETYPVNQMVAALRFIGKQDDGGAIYLGKTYLKDVYRQDAQAVTVAFFSVVNYEEDVMRDFDVGDILPPLRQTFKYMFPGIIDLPFRILPLDNLITTPVRAVQTMIRGAFKLGRNSLVYANELARGFPSFNDNRRRFQNTFKNDRNVRGKPEPTVTISLGPPRTTPMPTRARGLFGLMRNLNRNNAG